MDQEECYVPETMAGYRYPPQTGVSHKRLESEDCADFCYQLLLK